MAGKSNPSSGSQQCCELHLVVGGGTKTILAMCCGVTFLQLADPTLRARESMTLHKTSEEHVLSVGCATRAANKMRSADLRDNVIISERLVSETIRRLFSFTDGP